MNIIIIIIMIVIIMLEGAQTKNLYAEGAQTKNIRAYSFGKPARSGEIHTSWIRVCLSQTLRNPDS